MAERPTIDVVAAPGGWPKPWPNVAELADQLSNERWTLIGGLMVQLHAVSHHVGIIRPTNDVDIILHVETSRGVPAAAADALESLGYRLLTTIDPRNQFAHRFIRGDTRVDLLAGATDTVDVLLADHIAPRVVEKLRGHAMVRIEGGTQALRRTIKVRLQIVTGQTTTVSVPDEFGALVLKAAAYQTDTRDRDRHLYDAAVLLCCIEDPYVERERFAGSDRKRLMLLANSLSGDHPAWQQFPRGTRAEGQAALRLLSVPA
jgi:predicted nucleotidyltransferase